MVTDEELVRQLMVVLKNADFNTTTTALIRQQLEQILNADLSDRKAFIRQQVDHYLQEQQSNGSNFRVSGGPVVADIDEEEQNGQYLQGDEGLEQHDAELEQFRENIELAIEESSPTEKKRRAGGLNKGCQLSPELQAVIGESILPRTQVVKQLWVYIRKNNLQDPENRKRIICNDALRTLFETDSTDMFKMNKLLSKHIWSLDSAQGGNHAEPRPKKQKTPKKEGGKGKNSVFLAPHPISGALQNFFGTGETQVSRAEVVKRLWEYIKEHQLQDPADKKRIICDSKLQELFECDNFVGFSMTKLLSPHFVKE
ncbi:hypothetical protein O6H91_15G016800 [Diphasiastrum complanatum]|uniref:Uncharacterized protein n=2 Tax=Diphasiastrum complanatum TaxID=34168 RepID=A0ACC2BGB8_DIPCM|nr:hypothetical protein O6H91_15G016800 [Diphasiastrum complanatum]KAJ7528739.1 hypothetical protein O6H91_15G016800 [Diphasiastrum complanatum]